MAIVKSERQTKVTITVNTGTTASPTLKTRNLGSWVFSPDLTDTQFYTAGSLYGALQQHPVTEITKTERATLQDNGQ